MRKSLLRKITSVILSLIMVLGLSCTMPLTASAEGNEIIRDGFSVSYNITSEWENNQNIGISITNTGTQSIENWAFKYDASGEISGLWGGIINSSDETTYIIENAGYNMEIKPGQTIDFGYQLTGEALCAPSDFKLATKKVNIDSGYEISFNQTSGWGSDVVGEIIISNTSDAPIKTWELKFSGDFLISNIWNAKLLSYSDGNYIVKSDENSAIIQPGSSAAVGIQCQKIGDVVLNDVQLSHVIIGDGTDDPVIIDPEEDYETDTDDDGLPDFYENQIGTNLENPDTDGDGLTDFEEAAILGTDPLKTDTDDNGVSDPDEDPDEDGLTNRQELDLELDPLSPDTDYDGLNDGDEINIYGTDPLKYDTDGDEIGDGDEIIIGLDPNNTHTFDVHDSEYTFEQTISEDSGALYFVNSEESPYKLSIEITAAGNVEGNLSANESGYANAINNDAVLGMVPGLYYNESLKVDSVRLNFKIDEEYVPEGESVYSESIPELEGIKRLNIFKYFEDDNMLLPIETKYDIENNIIYTDVDELGTYCIMDIEKWLLSLGAEPEVQEEQVLLQSNSLIMSPQVEAESDSSYACGPTIIPSDNSIEVLERAYDESYSLSESQIAKSSSLVMSASSLSLSSAESITLNTAPADIVFILQATSDKYYERYYEKHKSDILAASKYIFETMPNARVAVIDFNESKSAYLLTDAGDQWAYSYEEIQQIVSKSIFTDNFVYCDRTKAFTLLLEESQYRTGASRFAFLMTCGAHYNSFFWFSSTHQSIYSSGKYNYSEISQIGFIYDDPAFEEKLIGWISEMNGLYLKTDTHCNEIIYKHIFDNAIGEIQEFNAITLTGLKKITLKTPLSSSSNTDTDSDGLNDWDEVDITSSLIQWNEDGTIVLPTLLECYNYKGEQKPYVSEGFCKYMLSHDSNPI
ncbi:MAG: cellulose binding domain-containing protein, partial [Oscillospiraceae bacterium]